MKKIIETAQGHVTGFFKIYANGSTGAGFNIRDAMSTEVVAGHAEKNTHKIYINGKLSKDAITSGKVLQKCLKKTRKKFAITVRHSTKLPIGYGLGLSGAGALSLSRALNKALGLKLKEKQVVDIAAKAEIEAGTGLGDVIAQQFMGMMIGLPPYPSRKVARLKNKYRYAVFAFFAPITTKKIIRSREWKKVINIFGDYAMKKVSEKKTADEFIRLCRIFAMQTKLLTDNVKPVLKEFPESSMAMLGETAFVLTNDPKETGNRLRKICKNTAVAEIS